MIALNRKDIYIWVFTKGIFECLRNIECIIGDLLLGHGPYVMNRIIACPGDKIYFVIGGNEFEHALQCSVR